MVNERLLAGSDVFKKLYGDAWEKNALRYEVLANEYNERFGNEMRFFSAPGRTEIAGNHTDHNHGRVLAAAVDLDTIAAAGRIEGNEIVLYSHGFEKPFVVDITNLSVVEEEKNTSCAIIRGICARFVQEGKPIGAFGACVDSTVKGGSGLSSSAAFEVLVVAILDHLFGSGDIDGVSNAIISQYAENVYFGKPCGLMDQTACALGGLTAIDFKDPMPVTDGLTYDFASKGYKLVVVNTGSSHDDLTDCYASIPQEMKAVAGFFGKSVLREVDEDEFIEKLLELRKVVSERAILRAMHFFNDNARVPHMTQALRDDDLNTFFSHSIASGESSWKLLQNIYPEGSCEQSLALALALSEKMLSGKGAWRVHGGGFAGTIQAFVPNDMLEAFVIRMDKVFGQNACTVLSIRAQGAIELNI